jgi:hypothetical protein
VSGGQATMAANCDSVLALVQYWDTTEFGVFGDGNGSRAYFGAHTTLATATTLASTGSAAPTCVPEGFTSETNNLQLGPTPAIGAQVSPTMASVQSSGSSRPASCSVAAGVGTLTGVAILAGGFCGLMASGGVDCGGGGQNVQLANGQVGGSNGPVPVGAAAVPAPSPGSPAWSAPVSVTARSWPRVGWTAGGAVALATGARTALPFRSRSWETAANTGAFACLFGGVMHPGLVDPRQKRQLIEKVQAFGGYSRQRH